jgi:hypothetical protein
MPNTLARQISPYFRIFSSYFFVVVDATFMDNDNNESMGCNSTLSICCFIFAFLHKCSSCNEYKNWKIQKEKILFELLTI